MRLDDEQRREVSRWLGTVAHELRNPLHTITTGLNVLEAGEAPRALAIIHAQLAHMDRLLDDIQDVAQLEEEGLTFHVETLSASSVIAHVADAHRACLEAHGRRLDVVNEAPAAELRADADRLQQILANLVVNADRHSVAGGPIELRAEERDGEVAFSVRDVGPGLDEERLQRVFLPFCQLHPQRRGMGLGLHLVRQMAERQGGRVEAHGGPPGCTFTVILPTRRSGRPTAVD